MKKSFSKLLLDLFHAYLNARKHKRNTCNQLTFEFCMENNLMELCKELFSGNYEISPSIYFVQKYPVMREIFAGTFRDRVVHHLVYDYISPFFEKTFIYDSYSCRKGKGTSMGVQRISKFIRSCSENYTKDCYILKLDIQGYFMAINKDILYKKIESDLHKFESAEEYCNIRANSLYPFCPSGVFSVDWILGLIHKIIYNDPTVNGIFKGKSSDYQGLPATKTLFHALPNSGLPIGNLTSQLFSNIYLNDFDHYIKESLGIKYYGRYVDDFVLIHPDKTYLLSLIPKIISILGTIGLRLNLNKTYFQHYSKGVSFLGAVIKPYRVYLKRATLGRWYQKIRTFNDQLSEVEKREDYLKYQQILNDFLPMMNSYLGFLSHYPSYKKRQQVIDGFVDVNFWDRYRVLEDYSKIF